MAREVPSLSPAGWVSGPAEKLDKLMSYYFVSEYSQSNLYKGQVKSLPKHIQAYGHDPLLLTTSMRESLQGLLQPYFDDITVDVTTETPNPDDPGRINVMVDIVVVQDGQRYSAGRELQTVNGTLSRIIDLNNHGASR